MPVPIGLICRLPTPLVVQLLSEDSNGFRILNMFNRESRPIITEGVVESGDSAVELADSITDSSPKLARISVRVRASRLPTLNCNWGRTDWNQHQW